MKKIPSQLLLSTVAFGVAVSLNASATTLKPINENTLVKVEQDIAELNPQLDITDRFMVTFSDPSALAAFQASADNAQAQARAEAVMSSLRRTTGEQLEFVTTVGSDIVVLEIAEAREMKAMRLLADKLAGNVNVNSAEPDPRRYPQAQVTPYGFNKVQANQVSDSNAGNRKVCIIDSGYGINHEDLSGNLHAGTNGLAGNWNTASGSHGTHVAGTIAAMENSVGVKGVMPNQKVNLHIIKVFNASGFTYASGLVGAVNDCVSAGSHVVNMSLGGSGSSTVERNGMQSALNNGVLLVAAAGNDSAPTHSYHASYDAVISVASVDANNYHTPFSQDTDQVEISGPGEAVYSTVNGDGRVGDITYGSVTLGNHQVSPLLRVVRSAADPTKLALANIDTDFSGDMAACTISGSAYNCGDMTGKVCIAERIGEQSRRTNNYPDINGVKACQDAGAVGAVIYSNSDRPAMKSNQVRDLSSVITIPSVSVSRAHGQQLIAAAGTNASVTFASDSNYQLYDGTSMASPHVAGSLALAWSTKPTCTATQVRAAMVATALDIESPGRDNQTGHGLIQTKALADKLADNCGGTGSGANALTKDTPVTIAGATNSQTLYTFAVPANSKDVEFNLSGGTGDADMFVKFGSAPTTSAGGFDCKSEESANTEKCSFPAAQTGTYHVMILGYDAYANAQLTATYKEDTGSANGGTSSVDNASASRRSWKRYSQVIPAGMSKLTVTTKGGTGDADLYLRHGSNPTLSNYTCRSEEKANVETCVINNPTAGKWYISLYAYRTFSGVDIKAVWE